MSAGGAELPQQLLAEAVDGAGTDLVDVDRIDEGFLLDRETGVALERVNDTKAPAQDAGAKFLGGLLREGGCEDSARRYTVDEYELQDAERQARGLARAGAGDDEEPREAGASIASAVARRESGETY